jgi:hypothetical protein
LTRRCSSFPLFLGKTKLTWDFAITSIATFDSSLKSNSFPVYPRSYVLLSVSLDYGSTIFAAQNFKTWVLNFAVVEWIAEGFKLLKYIISAGLFNKEHGLNVIIVCDSCLASLMKKKKNKQVFASITNTFIYLHKPEPLFCFYIAQWLFCVFLFDMMYQLKF